jgi:hypothetical protein
MNLVKDNKEFCKEKDKMTPFKIQNETIYIPVNYIVDDETFLNNENFKKFGLSHFNVIDSELKDFSLDYFDIQNIELDNDFFKKSQEFVDSLSVEEKIILSGYTYQGDAFVNKYLLSLEFEDKVKEYESYILDFVPKSYIFPLYVQFRKYVKLPSTIKSHDSMMQYIVGLLIEDIPRNLNYLNIMKKCIAEYYIDLMKIFDKAPLIEKKMSVFRGAKTMYYKNDVDDVYKNNTFMSTTINPEKAIKFVDNKTNCCLKKIILNPGFKAIFMEPFTQVKNELEILIAPHNSFKVVKNKPIKSYNNIENFNKVNNYEEIVDYFCDDKNEIKPIFQENLTLTIMETLK